MSAVAGRRAHPVGPPAPRFRRLLGATLLAQVVTALTAWMAGVVLGVFGLAPVSSATSPFLPWAVDDVWSAIAAAAWVGMVCALGGRLVADRLWWRGLDRPAAPLTWLAFGLAGYGARHIGQTTGARIALAVVLAPLLLRLLAYDRDGAVRAWPWPSGPVLSLGRRLALLAAAVLVVLVYTIPHPWVADGSGGPGSPGLQRVRIGQPVQFDVGLSRSVANARIERVTLGPGVGSGVVTLDAPVQMALDQPVSAPERAARLPARVPAGRIPWLTLSVRLTGCSVPPVRIDAVTLDYRELGIAMHERVALQSPILLACRG